MRLGSVRPTKAGLAYLSVNTVMLQYLPTHSVVRNTAYTISSRRVVLMKSSLFSSVFSVCRVAHRAEK